MSRRPSIVTTPRRLTSADADSFVFSGPGQDTVEKAAHAKVVEKHVTLNMRVTASFRREMKRLAYENELSMAEIVRQGVELWKERNDK